MSSNEQVTAGNTNAPDSDDEGLRHIYRREELNGQVLALKGRIIALLAIAGLLLFVSPWPDFLYFHLLLFVFGGFGLASYYWQQQPSFRPWHKHIFSAADFALLTVILIVPNPVATLEYPAQLTYHLNNSIYLYVVLLGLAFSYRPRTVIVGGIAGALCWTVGLIWMLSLPQTLSVLNVDAAKLGADPFGYIGKTHYVDLGVRLQEIVVFLICTGLVATLVARSRSLVHRQATAVRDRLFVREALGKYVPASVANAIINDRGALEPKRRNATMLFTDIEGFTSLVESMDPADVLAMLNAWFAEIGKIIVEESGVINQFQGDAVLATFNLPVADVDHAAASIRAALKIRQAAEKVDFAGRSLECRVGIATGDVVAGSVGSGQQLAYTVHGDAVNLASRLEQMNKETGTRILIAEATVKACKGDFGVREVGTVPVRGRTEETVYTTDITFR
jgi:adenylate cyclase